MLNTLKRMKRRLEKLTGYVPKTPNKAELKAAAYGRLGISANEILRFKKFGKEQQQMESYQSQLLGRPLISFNNYFWYFHSIEELFVDEVYCCVLSTDAPYILDCGANIGLSVIYFKQQWPKAKIVAFEPDPKNFDHLTKNIESFQLTDVTTVNK